ncbi:DUF637 domain-containing protein, partial [Serpentinimonas barnesii]|uniref:DUF637 domain-containing protein n=1 Tax=Serpentinimonas barnesii TaxID=1458427 RepID=UPI00149407C0
MADRACLSLINNGGDIGQTLRELGSKDSLRGLLTSMLTAGALSDLSSTLSVNGQMLSSISPQTAGFGANLGKAVIHNVASATINSALTGAKLQDSLKSALAGAWVSTAAGQTAHLIGDLTANNPALKALAHALAGCVAGAAGQGGNTACTAGAAGAVAGELAAQWINPSGDPSKAADTVAFASLMGGLAGALTTGDGSAASVNTAATTGANAALHNYLSHAQWAEFAKRLEACKTEAECDQVRKAFFDLSRGQNAAMRQACKDLSSAACRTHIQTALAGSQTQMQLVLGGSLPEQYLGGSDLNASARLTALNALRADIRQICASTPSCQAKNQAALNALGGTLLDFVPGFGDIKGFVEAQTPFDYLLAMVGAVGPVGDGLKQVLQKGSALYQADQIGAANQLFRQALGMDATAGLPSVRPSLSGNLSKTRLGQAATVQTDTLAQRLMIKDVMLNADRDGSKTERLVNDVLRSDPNMNVLGGTTYAGNKGLDHVVQFVDPADGITKTLVIDSKQLAKSGATNLNPRAAGTAQHRRPVMQLSDDSLRVIAQRLDGSPAGQAVSAAIDSGTLIKAVAYVAPYVRIVVASIEPKTLGRRRR